MAADSFGSLESPGLALGISEKAGQVGTVLTVAGERAHALPVGRRRQGFGNPGAQMRDTRGLQPVDRCHALYRAGANQRAGCRNKNGIKVIGLGPCEDVVHAPFGQRWIDQAEARQEVDDNAWVYPRWALPRLTRCGARRGVARQCLDQTGGRAH